MGPGLHPQYTRADFGQEAVGGPNNSTSPTQGRQSVERSAGKCKESSLNTSMRTEPNDVQEPNDAQETAQLTHGSGAELNHEDEISQVERLYRLMVRP